MQRRPAAPCESASTSSSSTPQRSASARALASAAGEKSAPATRAPRRASEIASWAMWHWMWMTSRPATVADRLAHGRLLDLAERVAPGDQRLGVVVGVLAVDGGHRVPVRRFVVGRINRQVKGETRARAGSERERDQHAVGRAQAQARALAVGTGAEACGLAGDPLGDRVGDRRGLLLHRRQRDRQRAAGGDQARAVVEPVERARRLGGAGQPAQVPQRAAEHLAQALGAGRGAQPGRDGDEQRRAHGAPQRLVEARGRRAASRSAR